MGAKPLKAFIDAGFRGFSKGGIQGRQKGAKSKKPIKII